MKRVGAYRSDTASILEALVKDWTGLDELVAEQDDRPALGAPCPL
jgi:hypothetical protein